MRKAAYLLGIFSVSTQCSASPEIRSAKSDWEVFPVEELGCLVKREYHGSGNPTFAFRKGFQGEIGFIASSTDWSIVVDQKYATVMELEEYRYTLMAQGGRAVGKPSIGVSLLPSPSGDRYFRNSEYVSFKMDWAEPMTLSLAGISTALDKADECLEKSRTAK